MLSALDEGRKSEHAQLHELLASKRYRGLLAKLARPAIKKVGADRRLGVVAAQLVRPASRGASRLGGKIAADAPALLFHKLRVRIKRLRYELEMMAPLGAKRHRRTLDPARGITGTARALSRHQCRDRVADVVCGDFRGAAPDHARGRRVDPVARQPRKQTAPSMHASVEAIRALGRDARHARGNSACRQIGAEACELARSRKLKKASPIHRISASRNRRTPITTRYSHSATESIP